MKAYLSKNKVFLLATLAFFSCSKESENADDTVLLVDQTSEMVVDQDFNWVSGLHGKLNVGFQNPDNISVNNELIEVVSRTGKVLAKAYIKENSASFNVDIPQNDEYFLLFPNTGNSLKITKTGNYNMTLTADGLNQKSYGPSSSSSCTVCDSPFENGGMESPVINSNYVITAESNVPGWETDASDNKIELWRSGFNGVPAQEGNQFIEINANQPAALYQNLCLDPGTTVTWSLYHRGRAGTDVAEAKIGADLASATVQELMVDGTNAWGYYTGTYTIPSGQTNTLFIFEAVSAAGGASVGNFIDNFEINCDQDGDGVIDDEDDFPTDPDLGFKAYFPTAGKQIIAFEDLWPTRGDYDFNDLVLSNQVEIAKDADGKIVEANFKVSIDAVGAGIHSGIAMMLYDENKQAFANTKIASVTGDASLDPSNTNGLIITNSVYQSQSSYYQNNGSGPSATPDTLSFTITFNEGAIEDFTPELYIFRTDDRGHEVHMTGYPQTATLNINLLNTGIDNGDFKTAAGLPWAIEIITEGDFNNPLEKVDMLEAYPDFQLWAISNGTSNTDWYDYPDITKVFSQE